MDARQEEIIAELRRVAELLKTETLTMTEFNQHSRFSVSTVVRRFGNWTRAMEAAGLKPNQPTQLHGKPTLPDDELLQEIIRLSSELGRIPTQTEMDAFGRFSPWPYRKRWGSFTKAVKVAFATYGVPEGISAPSQTVSALKPSKREAISENTNPNPISVVQSRPSRERVQYGEPIDFRGLRHAPVNEQGVVYMFGMVSREFGFVIESLRTAYPDCEGKRCVDEKRQLWERVLIEFEFRSSNFLTHGHDPEGCDLIVCWIDDWADCPLDVVELRSIINQLPNK